MSQPWLEDLAQQYRLPVERVGELYQQAARETSGSVYSRFIEMLEVSSNEPEPGGGGL